MQMKILNARIVLPDREVTSGTLHIAEGKIMSANAGCPEMTIVDFCGDIMIPGLIDLHVHGSSGADTMDGTEHSFKKMSKALLQQGTIAFLPTTMNAASEQLIKIISIGTEMLPAVNQAEILGFHMEGPCISEHFLGAQQKVDTSDGPFLLGNGVKIVTLAPELPQSTEWILRAQEAGIIVSAGHSGATYEQMLGFIEQGVQHVTHAFNAMPAIHHRMPGLLTAALLDPRVHIELIADGIHIHPAVLELALRLKSSERVLLVSDGTRAVGMPEGEYDLGGRQVRMQKGRMLLPDGTLAGSAATLLDGVRFMTEVVGRPLYEAVRMAALNPARLMGLAERLGSLETGREATFLRLGPDLALKEVWVRGRKIF